MWKGLVGHVVRGELDLLASSLTLTPDRTEIFDFLFPVGTETLALFIRGHDHQQSETVDWTTFVSPFSRSLWAVLGINMVLCAAGMSLLGGGGGNEGMMSPTQFVRNAWTVFRSYLGGRPDQEDR